MKFYGPIGYAETVETKPGVWEEQIAERMYYGDLTRNTRKRNQYSRRSVCQREFSCHAIC